MTIKRIFSTVSASFEHLVNQLENHQAVADSAITQAKEGTAKLRTQVILTEQKMNQLQVNIKNAEATANQWKARALAEQRDDLALDCLKAMQQQENTVNYLQQQLGQHHNLHAQLKHHLQEVESRLATMQLKRSELYARDTRAKLLNLSQTTTDAIDNDNIFGRWETQILEKECCAAPEDASLSLHNHYSKIEETQKLTQLLQSLRSQPSEN